MRIRRQLSLTLTIISLNLLGTACCSSGCPQPEAPAASQDKWEQTLDARKLLALDPNAKLTIKRDVHNLVISADAKPFADAFHAVMRDPDRRFGLIQVNRKRANAGKPFSMGERFQGRYNLADAARERLSKGLSKLFEDLMDDSKFAQLVCDIENKLTSDYGIISTLQLEPPDAQEFRLQYRYLEGSPIAGSSTFVVTQLEPGKCRLTQIFEYQEQDASFAMFFSGDGLKLHDQVVYSQATQAAELIGAKVLETDIPKEYFNL